MHWLVTDYIRLLSSHISLFSIAVFCKIYLAPAIYTMMKMQLWYLWKQKNILKKQLPSAIKNIFDIHHWYSFSKNLTSNIFVFRQSLTFQQNHIWLLLVFLPFPLENETPFKWLCLLITNIRLPLWNSLHSLHAATSDNTSYMIISTSKTIKPVTKTQVRASVVHTCIICTRSSFDLLKITRRFTT